MDGWEKLDARGEHELVCRARLEHLVPVGEPLVLISQIQRSGGTLLSRLFDGHPECHAHPYELKIGPGASDRWPDVRLDKPDKWFKMLFEDKVREHFAEGYSKPGLKDTDVDVLPFVFLPRLQKRIFDACVEGRPIERERDVLDCYMTSYFNAWLDNQNLYAVPKKVVTGFMPRLTNDQANLDRFFGAYPDGLLVSIVREPRAWYASASRHKQKSSKQKLKYRDLDSAMTIWRNSTAGALEAQERFGDRVILVTFQQLVLETEATMTFLADRIGIAMSPLLLTPTFNGWPVRANSSDPVGEYGVVADRIEAYRGVLDAETVERIDELAGNLYDRACERAGSTRAQVPA